MVLTVAIFAALDTATKFATALVPVLMLVWFRYCFQAVFTFSIRIRRQGLKLFSTENPRFQVLRGLLLLINSTCSFFGLQHMPVGEFTALTMLSPLVATGLSAVFLKHHVPRIRWILLMFGLLGVVLIARPGGVVFGWGLVFLAIQVFTYAWFQVLTGRLSGQENPYTTHFYTGFVGGIAMTPFMLPFWSTQALVQYWPWFVFVGLAGTIGHLMLIRAYMSASASVLAPYFFLQIAFATIAGWLVFNHAPDMLAWVGIAIIAASGVGNALFQRRFDSSQRS